MNRPVHGFNLRCNDLRDSASAIASIMRLIEEDQWRRDTDDETPFLTPGLTCGLSNAVTQLTERIHSLTDDLSHEYGDQLTAAAIEKETQATPETKQPLALKSVKRKAP